MNKNFVKYILIRFVQFSSLKISAHFYSLVANRRKQKKNFLMLLFFNAIKFEKNNKKLSIFVKIVCRSCQAWSTVLDRGSSLIGVRGFESLLLHYLLNIKSIYNLSYDRNIKHKT